MTDVTVPELAESITEASIDTWRVGVGDEVSAGQVIVTIETDKVVLEVPAPVAGIISEISKQASSDVTSGELIAKIAAGKQNKDTPNSRPPEVTDDQQVAQKPEAASEPAGKTVEVKVPELAESVSEASIAEWIKQPNDYVNAGDEIVKIETDKVVLDVPAPESGVLQQHEVAVGADVTSGQLLVQIIAAPKPSAEEAPVAPTATQSKPEAVNPAARKIATEAGIELSKVAGSGKDGRVTKGDVLDAIGDKDTSATIVPAPVKTFVNEHVSIEGTRKVERQKMSKLRSRVAERLLSSQQQTAMLSTFNEVDMSAVINIRKEYREIFEKRHGVKLGFMSFFVKAAAAALRQFPIVNAQIDGSDIVYHDYCDIGIAVGSSRGLVVPVLRNAETMSMATVERQIADFGQRAKDGKLTIDELSGGTFTITNGGVFGSMLSTPIINPPQSAILGVHATKERPVALNSQVVVRPMNYLALSYDHRLIDGRDAVLFLVAVKEALEEPVRVILEV